MNDLEVYEKVKTHLLTQKQRSARSTNSEGSVLCLYRGPNMLMCAAGCLIKDEFYSSDLENKAAVHEDVINAISMSFGVERISASTSSLISYLQRVHDDYTPDQWEEQLKLFVFNEDGTYNTKTYN